MDHGRTKAKELRTKDLQGFWTLPEPTRSGDTRAAEPPATVTSNVSVPLAIRLRLVAVVAGCFGVVGSVVAVGGQGVDPAAPASRATLDQYCAGCHNSRVKSGGIAFDAIDLANVPRDAAVWEKSSASSTRGRCRRWARGVPTRRAITRSRRGSKTRIDRAAAAAPNPGRPLLHRLNRAEYANAIRDLLDLDVDVSALLPPDDSAYGFDNIADVLGVSPSLQERYLSAAEKISALAVGDPDDGPRHRDVPRPPGPLAGSAHRGPAARHRRRHARAAHVPARRRVRPPGASSIGPTSATCAASSTRTQVEVDARRRARHVSRPIGGDDDLAPRSTSRRTRPTRSTRACGPRAGEGGAARRSASASSRTLGARRHRRGCSRSCAARRTRSTGPGGRTSDRSRSPGRSTPPGPATRRAGGGSSSCQACGRRERRRPARKQIIVDARAPRVPAAGRTTPTCSRSSTSTRPAAATARSRRGIESALQRDPRQPEVRVPRRAGSRRHVPPGGVYRISDVELASRLSFFLWSSIPDDELLDGGEPGQAASDRRCSSSRCAACWPIRSRRALVNNFAGQWLQLRNLRRRCCRTPTSSPISTTTCARRSRARRSCSSRASCAKTAASSTC